MALRSKTCAMDVPYDAGDVFEVVLGAVQDLGWRLEDSDGSPGEVLCSVPSTYPKSYGETIEILVTALEAGRSSIAMTSTIKPPMALDTFSVNRKNVERFEAAVDGGLAARFGASGA
jgi:hypothetical protein